MLKIRSTCGALLLADLCALCCALLLAWGVRAILGECLPPPQYIALLPCIVLFILLYAAFGLYPGVLSPSHYELKWLTIGTSLGFSFLSVLFFLGQQGLLYSRLVFLLGWLFALFFAPLGRYAVRMKCSGKAWWGYPVLLFTAASTETAVRRFANAPEAGLRICGIVPVVLARKDAIRGEQERSAPSLPLDDPEAAERTVAALHDAYPRATAFVMADGLSEKQLEQLALLARTYFKYLIVRPNSPWLKHFSLHAVDAPCGPSLCLRQNLLDPARMRMKRLIDILGCLLAAPFLLFLMPLIAACIRLDSKGPIFFMQERIGQNGVRFNVVKFRTMAPDAGTRLDTLLSETPSLRDEWKSGQKLANDPRLTRVGKILRRFSLDELPQIINIAKGEMSLVGPRPIVQTEISRYGKAYHQVYTRVKPGLTGLWQVSGRNDLRYAIRVTLDQQYVYNWSVWLDIYIICRTVPAMIVGKGAY